MLFDNKEPYITDVENYTGPMDRVSPYHYYQFIYWKLRGHWQKALHAWTRRPPCDATASISPVQALAGMPTALTITVAFGKTPLSAGGRVAVYCQKDFGGTANHNTGPLFQGPDGRTGYGSRITASASSPQTQLRIKVHSAGSVFTCVEVFVEAGEFRSGETLSIIFGDPASKPQTVCEKAKSMPFRIAVDYKGNGEFRPIAESPRVQVIGNRAAYLRCFAPPTPSPGEKVALRVIAADLENHNPSYNHSGEFTLEIPCAGKEKITGIKIPHDVHGTLLVQNVSIPESGVTRIRVIDEKNGLMGQSNPICTDIAPPGLHAYFGDIHSHTELSDGTGSCEDNFLWARDAEGLDFSALSDHFEDGASYNYTLQDKWMLTKEFTEKFNMPGRFVTLLGYEIGNLEAHRNVYFRNATGRMIVEGAGGERVTMDNVFQKLEGTDYILIPHAPKFHGINWNRPHDQARQRLVEICSMWGISEYGGTTPFLSVRHALDMGYKLGFTGGTDNHNAEPGNPRSGGITGVYAHELTREAIFDAFMSRHTFATNGARMTLSFSGHGAIMGDEVFLKANEKARFSARALTCDEISCMEIIRNGKTVHSISPRDANDAKLDWEDNLTVAETAQQRELSAIPFAYYYLRVTTVAGSIGWSSPIWITCISE